MPGDKFYKSKRWEHLRRAVLARDKYRCQVAARFGKNVNANTVHHIFPREDYPEYQWQSWNLMSVSAEAHNMLHERETNKLTQEGREIMNELAEQRGIKTKEETILVIGNPGTGKTTYCRKHLGHGLVYDLDSIAGAFRLKGPKEETTGPARWIANGMLEGFVKQAKRYVSRVLVIRTAPDIDELQMIDPDRLVVIYGGYNNQELKEERRVKIAQRIKAAVHYAKNNGIEVEEINADER